MYSSFNVVLCHLEIINIMDATWDLGVGSCGCNVHLSFYKLQLTNHKSQWRFRVRAPRAIKVEHLLHFKVLFSFSFLTPGFKLLIVDVCCLSIIFI